MGQPGRQLSIIMLQCMCTCTEVASIPGRVFAFITVRRTTGPGTSCLRMCQSFVTFIFVYYRVLEVSSRFIIIGIDWNGS